jgi:hypothetical protein
MTRKPVMIGLDFARDAEWQPILRTREGAMAYGRREMPPDLKKLGFGVAVWEGEDYFRISYGKEGVVRR